MSTSSIDEVVDLIENAAEHIERHGWHQHDYAPPAEHEGDTPEGKPVCILGALATSLVWVDFGDRQAWTTTSFEPTSQAASEAVAETLGGHSSGELAAWNDTVGRTAQEVLDLLHRAAKELQREGEIS
jgi:hypothetical protein